MTTKHRHTVKASVQIKAFDPYPQVGKHRQEIGDCCHQRFLAMHRIYAQSDSFMATDDINSGIGKNEVALAMA